MIRFFTKKAGAVLAITAIATVASGAGIDGLHLIHPVSKAEAEIGVPSPLKCEGCAPSEHRLDRKAAKVKRDAGKMSWTILIEEDFSSVTEGSVEQPSEDRLCYFYGEPGPYINNDLTKQPGWSGSDVYAAGGTVMLKAEGTGACINTPLGDYSGNLTISFRYKIAPESTESAIVLVNVLKNGIGYPTAASCDANYSYFNVTPGQNEWRYAEITCINKSADNDGFVQFQGGGLGSVLIDDIEITAKHDYIAPPALLSITNFTETSFQANWEPVSLATYYYMQLQKRTFTSDDENYLYNIDFEDITSVPQGWTISNFSEDRITNEGNNGTKGLVMNNGDYLETPYNYSKYHWLKLFGHTVVPDGFDTDELTGYILFSLLSDTGWVTLNNCPVKRFLDPWSVDFGAELFPYFNNNYYGMKIELFDMNEGVKFMIDDFQIETGRPSKMETIISQYDYVYVPSSQTYYVFNNLDPNSEYYYGVISYSGSLMSEPATEHAFGVATPPLMPATNMTKSSYTANWQKVAKGNAYNVTNYGVYEAKEDESDHVLMYDDFSKIDASVTSATSYEEAVPLENYTATNLDEYMQYPGWTGLGNTLYQGGIGVMQWAFTHYYLETPPMSLNNDDKFYLTLMGHMTYDDMLIVKVNDQQYNLEILAGEFSGEFEVPECGDNITVRFFTQSGSPFGFEFIEIAQDLKEGQFAYTFLGTQKTDADTTSATFSNLSEDFGKYAYNVTSEYTFEGNTVYSAPTDYQYVTLSGPAEITNISAAGTEGVVEVERYSVDGKQLDSPAKGVNIIRMSDGSVRKVMVK